jgi:hypothetical protein
MALVSVIVAYLSVTPINFPLMAVTAVCTILAYFSKNLIPWLRSDSPPSSLSFINIVSGILMALATAFTEGVGTYLLEGKVLWPIVLKISVYTTGTYLLSTFFAPPHSTEKKRLFASRSYIERYKKIAAIVVLFLALSTGASAQSPFRGFFKPVSKDLFSTADQMNITADQDIRITAQSAWLVRPIMSISAMQFLIEKPITVNSFGSMGTGVSYAHFCEHNGEPYMDYSFNFLVLFGAKIAEVTPVNLSLAASVSALQYINVGAGYSFEAKRFFFLTGISYNFN